MKSIEKERSRCAHDIWKFSNELFSEDKGNDVDPTFSKDKCDSFFRSTYSNASDIDIEVASWMTPRHFPTSKFNLMEITLEELWCRLNKSRNGSAPGPIDQIPYSILKRLPSCSPVLLHIFNCCLSSSLFPHMWQMAVIKLISKPAAKSDSDNPTNFRPIALTSCIGKLFTAILKQRVLDYAVHNAYLDTSIQKAFVDGIPGCLENHLKLSEMIKEAKYQQRNLTLCWIDLVNAYGSVQHRFIYLALEHYHLPVAFVQLIRVMYTNLSAVVATNSWTTSSFSLQIGIFQGDPLSVVIFNLVINLYVDFIHEFYYHLGYCFSGSSHTIPLLQYADDSCLVSNSLDNCQVLCLATDKWLAWANMKAKVPKCKVLEIRRGKMQQDPQLYLSRSSVPAIEGASFRFLGLPVSDSLDNTEYRLSITQKLNHLMTSLDLTHLRRKQKLKVYSIGVCSRLTWLLMIITLPITWVERNLDTIATPLLKKWAGLARCATPAILYMKASSGGLGIPSISTSYKKLQVSQFARFLMSRDPTVRFLADHILQDDLVTTGTAFQPSIVVCDSLVSDPGMSGKTLKRMSQSTITESEDLSRVHHLQSLEVQGECFRLGDSTCIHIWSTAVPTLPDIIFKFALNATLDTLPHQKNLHKWRKAESEKCPLCGKVQSLLHVLNNCSVALNQRHYDNRHNTVLTRIKSTIESHRNDYLLIADLPGCPYNRPNFLASDLRPDIVMWTPYQTKQWTGNCCAIQNLVNTLNPVGMHAQYCLSRWHPEVSSTWTVLVHSKFSWKWKRTPTFPF